MENITKRDFSIKEIRKTPGTWLVVTREHGFFEAPRKFIKDGEPYEVEHIRGDILTVTYSWETIKEMHVNGVLIFQDNSEDFRLLESVKHGYGDKFEYNYGAITADDVEKFAAFVENSVAPSEDDFQKNTMYLPEACRYRLLIIANQSIDMLKKANIEAILLKIGQDNRMITYGRKEFAAQQKKILYEIRKNNLVAKDGQPLKIAIETVWSSALQLSAYPWLPTKVTDFNFSLQLKESIEDLNDKKGW
ncbi:MAG: hypothetical protein LBR70_05810 [Lactobacillaceae bacterium]|jgi:hypothetical protein|nr:hypothetical protein [Lactobacillaceae bacterium]